MKNYTKEMVLEAIEQSGGIISTVQQSLKKLGGGSCSWATAKKMINKWAETKEAYNDELERFLDIADTTILQSMLEGDVNTAKFVAMTKGKHRGYTKEIVVRAVEDFSDLPEDLKKWGIEDFARATFQGMRAESNDLEDEIFEQGEGA